METISLSSITLNDRNPRTIKGDAFDRLCESIKRDPQFMVLRPIVVDADGIIIGGNQRYLACKKLGMKDVPASWVARADDLTPEQRKRFIAVDNAPAGIAGEWDIDILAADYEFEELEIVGLGGLLYSEPPNFQPGTEDEQGRLDQLQPKFVTCPHCQTEFDAREQI